jgi:hypothetical protein
VKHGERIYRVSFIQHEYGAKKTNILWETLVASFRFTD